ncbi:hypothetical protein [Streptacidiphilus rugosus]|uniref:hypothetical protein n=1 Tax=Streptacidiphilus rugosus TaxID=405783 RepID=UPI00056D5A96|nr:hypothetical protein [Streptacidiphilus rugosus]
MTVGEKALQELDRFDVAVDYGRKETTFWLRRPGEEVPVARMHKARPYDSDIDPYRVHAAVDPDAVAGFVRFRKAWTADRTLIGEVGRIVGFTDRETDPVVQHDLGELRPTVTGLAGGVRRVDAALDRASRKHRLLPIPNGIPFVDPRVVDAFTSVTIAFAGPDSAGFEVTRPAGVTAAYEVAVHDPRVSRVLVLAYVERLSRKTFDPRRTAVDLTTNPFADLADMRRQRKRGTERDRP